MPDFYHQQACFIRQVDDALGFSQTQVTKIAGSVSLKTFGQTRWYDKEEDFEFVHVVKGGLVEPHGSKEGGTEEGAYPFTEVMLEFASFDKHFATGPEDPMKLCHFFYCMICKKYISMMLWGFYELKKRSQ